MNFSFSRCEMLLLHYTYLIIRTSAIQYGLYCNSNFWCHLVLVLYVLSVVEVFCMQLTCFIEFHSLRKHNTEINTEFSRITALFCEFFSISCSLFSRQHCSYLCYIPLVFPYIHMSGGSFFGSRYHYYCNNNHRSYDINPQFF